MVGLLTCKNRLPYNLYCVGGDVKHCSIQYYNHCLSLCRFCQTDPGESAPENLVHFPSAPPMPIIRLFVIASGPLSLTACRMSHDHHFCSIACTVADNSGRPGLHLADRGDLFISRTRTTRLGRRSFFITAPVVWNSLPLHLRFLSISCSHFQAGLKTVFHWLLLWELLKRLNWTASGPPMSEHLYADSSAW